MDKETRDALEECAWWLEGALQCKDWVWDPDQREAAEHALSRAKMIIEKPTHC